MPALGELADNGDTRIEDEHSSGGHKCERIAPMSRQRDRQREDKKELARQLGITSSDVDDDLRSHARVCEPSWKVELVVDDIRRGLLQRARPLALHLALFVIDHGGPRLALAQSFAGPPTKKGTVSLTPGSSVGPHKVRSHRPGSFVVVALLPEGAGDDESALHGRLCADPGLQLRRLGDGAAPLALSAPALRTATFEEPHAVDILHGNDVVGGAGRARFCAAVVCTVPAAHRVSTTMKLPLLDKRGRATAHVALRV